MPFKNKEVATLLAECRRHCCICYRFCGIKTETDHMVPEGEGGSNDNSGEFSGGGKFFE
jgi:hypothetical protein